MKCIQWNSAKNAGQGTGTFSLTPFIYFVVEWRKVWICYEIFIKLKLKISTMRSASENVNALQFEEFYNTETVSRSNLYVEGISSFLQHTLLSEVFINVSKYTLKSLFRP